MSVMSMHHLALCMCLLHRKTAIGRRLLWFVNPTTKSSHRVSNRADATVSCVPEIRLLYTGEGPVPLLHDIYIIPAITLATGFWKASGKASPLSASFSSTRRRAKPKFRPKAYS
ncbi:hypothetical protein DFH94DRAFT_470220 [Russula ochroleuca]|uniref:Secreted protein n=1 Tax=Russula ochroleuca TaxID=152965 RepID=A0A9P5MWF4_9AGAM|nr:hypothetical protein DFH94DRAFT_470220 [Russula ochroleuca]